MAFWDSQRREFLAIGSVDHESARLWFRGDRAGRYVVEVKGPSGVLHGRAIAEIAADNPRDNTMVVRYPQDAVPGTPSLSALTRYTVRVAAEDGTSVIGEGQFETAPASPEQTPASFSIGVVSCHQPFDEKGDLSPDNMRLLEQLPALFRGYDIKFMLGAGDQIYADTPGAVSLLSPHFISQRWPGRGQIGSWPLEQIRAAYQERYRICWNQNPWLKLLSSWPNYAMLDDHEVLDDWGTEPMHASPPYQKLITAARLAYMDYQGSRQLPWTGDGAAPTSFDYGFRYGTLASFVFDLRSERRPPPQARVVSAEQIGRFKAFLAANADAHVVLVTTTVPFVHIPEWLAELGEGIFGTKVDFPDHWSAKRNQPDRNAILDIINTHLSAHPKQRLIVVGGDVHVGCAFVCRLVGGAKPRFYELTTSSVSNRMKDFDADRSALGPKVFGLTPTMADGKLEVSLLPSRKNGPDRNPIGGLNAGIIECKRNGDETNVRLKLIGYGPDRTARSEFESAWL